MRVGLIVLLAAAARADGPRDEGAPQFLREVNAVHQDRSKTDEQIVRELARYLDRELSAESPRAHRIAALIRLIAHRYEWKEPRGRPRAVGEAMKAEGYANPKTMRDLLSVALALARGDGRPADVAIRLIGADETDKSMLLVALEALAPAPPITAVPRLLVLTKHPFARLHQTCVGPDADKIEHPVRELACRCLNSMKIGATAAGEGVVTVDRPGLLARLQEWFESPDEEVWRQAADVIVTLAAGDTDVADLAATLREKAETPQKRQALQQE